jgi:rhamnogalacturonyl hydrolase YesR
MKTSLTRLTARTKALLRRSRLPDTAKRERQRDSVGVPSYDPGPDPVIRAGIEWLCTAQDHSRSQDGGVAALFSLATGWTTSYPETTGYIIPTFLKYANDTGNEKIRERARKMLDWITDIQLDCGGFQGHRIGAEPKVPVAFNTGQILLGLAAGVHQFGECYRRPMQRAADWLVHTQDADGCWRQFQSPFVKPGDKVYDTHIAWGLLEAERQESGRRYLEAALRNSHWAISHQTRSGWFANCCLSDTARPLTHTMGYALRGLLEVYLATHDHDVQAAVQRNADGLLAAVQSNGYLPGRLDEQWQAGCHSSCLTGSVQLASCYFLLGKITGDPKYRGAAKRLNSYVRKTISIEGPPHVKGAVKGSFPIDGDYASYEYINWACKFAIDANVHEIENN